MKTLLLLSITFFSFSSLGKSITPINPVCYTTYGERSTDTCCSNKEKLDLRHCEFTYNDISGYMCCSKVNVKINLKNILSEEEALQEETYQ